MLFLFIFSIFYCSISVHVHFCRWQGGILCNLYSGKVMCMFPAGILYVVYSLLVADLLGRVESCVIRTYVELVTWLCTPDTLGCAQQKHV
jgi:hypothetical protein